MTVTLMPSLIPAHWGFHTEFREDRCVFYNDLVQVNEPSCSSTFLSWLKVCNDNVSPPQACVEKKLEWLTEKSEKGMAHKRSQ